MSDSSLQNGYILLARKITHSEIMKKPPLYLKVWIYLLTQAQHRPYKELKRGQLITSIPDIQEACSWYIGARKHTPTKREIQTILNWMRGKCDSRNSLEMSANVTPKCTMIVTTKVTHGMLVTIENYRLYQTPTSYERYAEMYAEPLSETEPKCSNTLQYKQECIKNVQECNKDDNDERAPQPQSDKSEDDRAQQIIRHYQFDNDKPFPLSIKEKSWLKKLLQLPLTAEEIIQEMNEIRSYKESKNEAIHSFSYYAKTIIQRHRQEQAAPKQEEATIHVKPLSKHRSSVEVHAKISSGKVGWLGKSKRKSQL